jgi:hypothetical protein
VGSPRASEEIHNICGSYFGFIETKEIAIIMLSNIEPRRKGIDTSPIPPRNAHAGDTN